MDLVNARWPAGQQPAALVMNELTKHVPEEAISEVLTRQDGSCTFYAHSDYVDTLLRASGQNSFFIKETTPVSEFHWLWLEQEVSLAETLTMATEKDCFGIARKGGAARAKLALRFRNKEAMVAFAQSNGIRDTSNYGRWKITGVDITVGTFGLLGFLVARGFDETEVLYLKDSCGVFLSLQCGDTSPGYYVCNGARRQFTFKALNSVAKEQAATKSQASRPAAKAAASQSTVSKQQAFFRRVHKPSAKLNAPASPRKEAPKHKSEAKSGLTPETKAAKEHLCVSPST